MTIRRFFACVMRYGMRGIIDYALGYHKRILKNVFFHKLERTSRHEKMEKGITIVGNFAVSHSLSKVLRDLAISLKKANIPYQAFNTNKQPSIPDSEFSHLLTPVDEFSLNKYSHVIEMFNYENISLKDKRCQHWRIAFWEFESGLTESHPEFIDTKHLITMSDFNYKVLKKLLPQKVNVRKLRYPFQFDVNQNIAPVAQTRMKYGLMEDDFVVFFNFSYKSSYYRKNPEGLISAFAKAFPGNPKTKIFLKTQGAGIRKSLQQKLDNHIKNLGLSNRVISCDEFLTQNELIAVTKACDVYASLHRGEGLGLGIAEAMSLGIPAIVTNYSAPTEFCRSDNSCLIPYEMVDVPKEQKDLVAYNYVKQWAEPNIEAAAVALKRLYEDVEYRSQLGMNAKQFIAEYFSTKNFVKSVAGFLDS